MIELSVSGRSEGLAASSNIAIFTVRAGSITDLLANRLHSSPEIALPFGVLGIWVEALDHTDERAIADEIDVKSIKKLMKHHSGNSQKLFEFTIGSSFYHLSADDKAVAIAKAFAKAARLVAEEFPDVHGLALSNSILDSANEYVALSGAGPNNSFKPIPLRGPA